MKIEELIELLKPITEKKILNLDILPMKFNTTNTILEIECIYCHCKTNPCISDFLRRKSKCRCQLNIYKNFNSIKEFSKVSDDYKIKNEQIIDEKFGITVQLIYDYVYFRPKDGKNLITIRTSKVEKLIKNIEPGTNEIKNDEPSSLGTNETKNDIDLTKYVKNNEIFISKSEFKILKEQPNIVRIMTKFLVQNFNPMMYKIYNSNFKKDFEALENKNIDIALVNDELCITPKNWGLNTLNYFVYHLFIKARKNGCSSFYEIWNTKKLEDIVRRVFNYGSSFNNNTMFKTYGDCYGRLYNFPPSVAKAIYNRYNAKKILDFSAGFGGRLLGFWASNAEEYIGIDPNTNVPYSKMIEYFTNTFSDNKKAMVINKPAEDVDYSQIGSVDTIFTSPPYFDTEIYDDHDPNQSCNRYKAFEIWINKFLFTVISKTTSILEKNGILAINIKDHKKYPIIDRMINYIENTIGLTKVEYIKFLHPKRYVNNNNYEYIYVYRKTN